MLRKLLLLSLLLPSFAAAQSVRYQSQVIGSRGLPLANQSVAVCTQPAVTTTQPCSPLATLATSAITTSGGANPLTTDSNGNFFFYIAPGTYTIQIYGPQVGTPFVQPDTTLSCNPAVACTITGAITVTTLNSKVYCGPQAGADASIKANAAIAAVIAAGGGTVDCTDLGGVQTISQQINVGNSSSVPVTLLMANNANWGMSAAFSPSSGCGMLVFNNSTVLSQTIGTGQTASISTSSASTSARGVVCTSGILGGTTNSFRIEGLSILNNNGATLSDAAVVINGCKDQSMFRHNNVVNPFGIGLHIGGTAAGAGCNEFTVADNWINGQNGDSTNLTAQPVVVTATASNTVFSLRWFGGSIVEPGKGQNAISFSCGVTFFCQDDNFYGVHMESTISSGDTTPLVQMTGSGGINWYGGSLLMSFPGTAYCFQLSGAAASFRAAGVECGSPSKLINNTVTGIAYGNASGQPFIDYFSDGANSYLGGLGFSEGSAPTNLQAGVDTCYGDSPTHMVKCSLNNGPFRQVVFDTATQTLTNKTLNVPFSNGTALQFFNTTTTCTTAASVGATCTTAAITLPVAEADTAYRVACTGKGITNVPTVIATTNSSATQFTLTIAALTAAAASFTSYDCTVGHN